MSSIKFYFITMSIAEAQQVLQSRKDENKMLQHRMVFYGTRIN